MENNQNQGGRFFNDTKFAISMGVMGFLVISVFLVIFLFAQTIKTFSSEKGFPSRTITIVGEGEILSVPDVATFSYTVSEVAESVDLAQQEVAKRNNEIVALLNEQEIEDKDIKTLSYNIYPKYEWQSEVCFPGQICRGGKNVLVGQEVSQVLEVKIRDIDKSGEVLALVGKKEVTNVSNLRFTIDDESALRSEARELAIIDAKEKAKDLAKNLDVRLKRIVSFNEQDERYYPMGKRGDEMINLQAMSADASIMPEIPTGENTIRTKVYVTFEI